MANPNNPYEFFMSSQPPVRPTILPSAGSSLKQRLLIVVGGVALLIIVLVLVFGVLLKGGSKGLTQMYEVAASQEDLITLTDAAKNEIKDQQLLNTSTSISAVVNTHHVQAEASIKKMVAVKVSTVKIKALLDTSYESSLASAKTNNTYDETFTTILANRVDSYRTKLQAAYSIVASQSLKNELNEQYIQINQLKLTP